MYNIIVTSYRNEARHLILDLRKYGKFNKTSFRDVLTGTVLDVQDFLNKISEEPPLSLARVVPVSEVIEFATPAELLEKLINKFKNYKTKKTFRVTVERRGHKGEINSQDFSKKIGSVITGKVNLNDPEEEIVIEIMEKDAGIIILTKKMKEKHYLIKAN